MSEIFISYARSTAAQAEAVSEALRALGYDVWRDDDLPAHRSYTDVIDERLRSAKAVVVIWSAEAVKSQWVRAEADVARQAGTLVQLSIDGAVPPLPFNQIQCADMNVWSGDTDAPGWRKVVASVAELINAAAPKPARLEAEAKQADAPRSLSICVLPFANMSDDPQQEYFSDGISEDIITDLSKVSALFLVARNTSFQFKGKSVDVQQIARQLKVSHVLEGSVRKAGGRVRITAQLIDGASGGHIWAERYDRDLNDIFELQDEISEAIVNALKLKLLPEERNAIERRGTNNLDAYNLFLMARQLYLTDNVSTARGSDAIIRLCTGAIKIDPNYAQAWALMAFAMTIRAHMVTGSEDVGLAAAERALSLDATLPVAHAAKARHFTNRSDFRKAWIEIEAALRLDPRCYEANIMAGNLCTSERRFQDAIPYYEKAAELFATSYAAFGMLLGGYVAICDRERAHRCAELTLVRAQTALGQEPDNGAAMGCMALSLGVLGERERVKEVVARGLLLDPDNEKMRSNFVRAFVQLHDSDGVLSVLDAAVKQHGKGFYGKGLVRWFVSLPELDSMLDDPRMKDVIETSKADLAREKDT